MAEFILKHPYPNPPAWASIEKGAVKWVKEAAKASAFPSEADAMAAFGEAKKTMMAKAEAKLKRDLAAGKKIKDSRYYYAKDRLRDPKIDDCAPQWLLNNRFKPVTESRSNSDDLLGVLELWFVRGSLGWLRDGRDRRMEFDENFNGAKPFLSIEAARAALAKSYGSHECSFIRGSMAFSQVVASSPTGSLDPQARAISAACEAREIGAEIQAAATARLEDMKTAAERPRHRL